MRLCKEWKLALAVIAVAAVVACGGGGGAGGETPPVATLSAGGPAIPRDREIVIRFSESMNPASLELSGTMAAEAAGTWSKTDADNDTYTLRPADGTWSMGVWLDLMVKARDASGEALAAPAAARYLVPLEFTNGDEASLVIGQEDFSSSAPNRGASAPAGNTLWNPHGPAAIGADGRLFIADTSNRRVLAFDSVPVAGEAAAVYALGAPNLETQGANEAKQDSVGLVEGVSIAGGKMAIVDYGNNRVLIHNPVPGRSGDLPAVVVGQAAFDANAWGCSDRNLNAPEAATLTPGGKLIVADSGNNRVLVWNTVPTTHGRAADLVLGQQDFTQCAPLDADSDGTPEASRATLYSPTGVWSDDTRLVVNDHSNHRVLIWNTFPSRNFQEADVVLGQHDFVGRAANDDDHDGHEDAAPTARTLKSPYMGLASNGVQLAVADGGNRRVLIWNAFPVENFQPADVVLGQANLQAAEARAPSKNSVGNPTGLHFSGDKLFVTDQGNHRVLIFKSR